MFKDVIYMAIPAKRRYGGNGARVKKILKMPHEIPRTTIKNFFIMGEIQ